MNTLVLFAKQILGMICQHFYGLIHCNIIRLHLSVVRLRPSSDSISTFGTKCHKILPTGARFYSRGEKIPPS